MPTREAPTLLRARLSNVENSAMAAADSCETFDEDSFEEAKVGKYLAGKSCYQVCSSAETSMASFLEDSACLSASVGDRLAERGEATAKVLFKEASALSLATAASETAASDEGVSFLEDSTLCLHSAGLVSPYGSVVGGFSCAPESVVTLKSRVKVAPLWSKVVLMVEDVAVNALAAQRILGRFVKTIWVEKSQEALKALRGEPFICKNEKKVEELKGPTHFDAAFVDFDLSTSPSALQGPDLVREFRAFEIANGIKPEAATALPIFTFTSHYSKGTDVLSVEHEKIFDGIVFKPINKAQVRKIFNALFEGEEPVAATLFESKEDE